jgi:SAM-dependent methyltransferase
MARPRPRNRKAPQTKPAEPIRPAYDRLGPDAYYAAHGHDYANPHEPIVRRLLTEWYESRRPPVDARILDLACGSGEVTCFFLECGHRQVTGADPFTAEAYRRRTGLDALPLDFVSIAQGALADRRYDFVICSFALHLAESGLAPQVCVRLAEIAPELIVLTPHKRPEIKPTWGWRLVHESILDRVRLRQYASTNPQQA